MQTIQTVPATEQTKQKIDYVPFHAKAIEASLELLDSRMTGLNDDEVEKRQRQYGRNLVTGKSGDMARRLFLHQFKNLVVLLLMVAAVLSFYMQQPVNGYAILVAMFVNATISFMTKWKAQKAILALEAF